MLCLCQPTSLLEEEKSRRPGPSATTTTGVKELRMTAPAVVGGE